MHLKEAFMAEFPLLRVALKDGRTVSIRHAIGSDVPRLQKFVEAYMLDGEGQTLEHDEFKVTMERQWQRLTDSLKNPKENSSSRRIRRQPCGQN